VETDALPTPERRQEKVHRMRRLGEKVSEPLMCVTAEGENWCAYSQESTDL
jgi:hypothetical protein